MEKKKIDVNVEELLNKNEIQKAIKNCNNILNNYNYKCYIKKVAEFLNLSQIDMILELFNEIPILKISSYRKFLRYEGEKRWKKYKNENEKMFSNLSIRLCDFLKTHTIEESMLHFKTEIDYICKVTKKNINQIENMLLKYRMSYQTKNNLELSAASSNIKSLIKDFNAKAKEEYINEFIQKELINIESFFSIRTSNESCIEQISVQNYISMILQNSHLRNSILLYIKNNFDKDLDTNEMLEIIFNILTNQDSLNHNFFNIENSTKLLLLPRTKAYNRLKNNYLPKIKKYFNPSLIFEMNRYLASKVNIKNDIKIHFTKYQLSLLEEIKPILAEGNAEIIFVNNNFEIQSDKTILDPLEEQEAKSCLSKIKCYHNLCNLIKKSYYNQCKIISEFIKETNINLSKEDVPFTDENYYLNDFEYIYNLNPIINILTKINPEILLSYKEDASALKKSNKILYSDSLLACVLASGTGCELIAKIINNIPAVLQKNLNIDLNFSDLSSISKAVDLAQYVDNFTLSLLGEEVTKKIVYNAEFLQRNNPKDIAERIAKANDLMIKAETINKSAIPYFAPIAINNIKIERYLNNDSNILTSGIDTNTCFKLSANDNDYLFYSILNKNGMVCKILESNKIIGRITAHRFSNVLMINGIRTRENDYQATSIEKLERNNLMIETVKAMAQNLIELTSTSDCPIDFVVSNKAGILEAPEYNSIFPLLSEHLFRNPIDCFHEDFQKFRTLYSEKAYLQQVPYYNGSGSPFTTDFGSYPVVLIAARKGKDLEKLWDISTKSPDAIYSRPNLENILGTGKLSYELIRRIEKFDALHYFQAKKSIAAYHRPNLSIDEEFEFYEITESYYNLINSKGKNIIKIKPLSLQRKK